MAPQTLRSLPLASYEAERVADVEQRYETPKWRTFWVLAAFALLIGVGIVTVLLPELEDEPDRAAQEANGAEEEAAHTDPLQE